MQSYQSNKYFLYFCYFPHKLIGMIRTNPSSSRETLHYKNIIYQGSTKNHKIMNGSGLLYFFTDKNIIISERIQNNHIKGPSIFIYGRTTYHYGTWKYDKPHGICYFRINDVLIIAQYSQGALINSKQVFVFLEKSNIGAIMEYTPEGVLKIKWKQEIYCHEHILKLLEKGGFQVDKIVFSLLKFINTHFNSSSSCIKLRYVDDSRYKFGVQNGFSVYFNEREEIQIFQIDQTSKNSPLPSKKNGHIYLNNGNGATLDNQIIVNPSLAYYEQLKDSLSQAVIKNFLSGAIKDLNSSRNNGINLSNIPIQIRQKEKKRIGEGTLSKIYPPTKQYPKQASQKQKQPQRLYNYVNYLQQYPPRQDLRAQIDKIRHIFQHINEEIEIVKLDQQTQTIAEKIPPKIQQKVILTPSRTKGISQQKISSSTKKKIFDFNINRVNRASDSSKKNKTKIFVEGSNEAKVKESKQLQREQSSQYDWQYEQQPPITPIHALKPQIKQFTRAQPKIIQKQSKDLKLQSIPSAIPPPRKQSSQIQDEDMTNLINLGRQQKEKKKNALPLKVQSKNEPYKKQSHQKHTYHIHQPQSVKLKPQILLQPKSPLLPYQKKQANIKQQQPFKILIPHREGYPTGQQPLNRIQRQQRTRSYYLDLHARNLKY